MLFSDVVDSLLQAPDARARRCPPAGRRCRSTPSTTPSRLWITCSWRAEPRAATTGPRSKSRAATRTRTSARARASSGPTRSSITTSRRFLVDEGDPEDPEDDDYSCDPIGTSGDWWAASGEGFDWETGRSLSRTLAPTRSTSRFRSPMQAIPSSSSAASRSTTSSSRPVTAARRSRTTATRSTAGSSPIPRKAARRTRTPGRRSPSSTTAAAPAPRRKREGLVRAPAGDHRLPERRVRDLPVQDCRGHRRQCLHSASPSRRRPGPSIPRSSSPSVARTTA